jgi:hypothetical protein
MVTGREWLVENSRDFVFVVVNIIMHYFVDAGFQDFVPGLELLCHGQQQITAG